MSFKKGVTSIQELERQIADLEARLPAHSVPPAMIEELEALEEALERLKAEQVATQAGQDRPADGRQTE
jgi:HAMP domain-containing protein